MGIEGISATERPRRDVDWGWNAPAGAAANGGAPGRRGRSSSKATANGGATAADGVLSVTPDSPADSSGARAADRSTASEKSADLGERKDSTGASTLLRLAMVARTLGRRSATDSSPHHGNMSAFRSWFSCFSRVGTGRFFLVDTPMPGDFRLTTLPSPPPLPLVEQAYSRRTCTASSPGRLRTSPRSQSASFEATSSRWATTNGA